MALFLLICLLACTQVARALIDCDNVLSSAAPFTGSCNNKWSNLKPLVKPTQSGVGWAWVTYKLNKSFGSSSDAQSEMDDSPTPVAIGPDGHYYVVDDHHTLSALDYSGYDETSVTLNVICDKRQENYSMADFFADLSAQGLCYLGAHPKGKPNGLPELIPYTALPKDFSFTPDHSSFADDRWRALAGFSRKVTEVEGFPKCGSNDDKNCERCFYRGCGHDGQAASGKGVPFFEFQWAYFLNDATISNPSLWPTKEQFEAFSSAYKALPESSSPKAVKDTDTDAWLSAAALAVPLCRGQSVAGYRVPTSLYKGSGVLPGFVTGPIKLEADPQCSAPQCN